MDLKLRASTGSWQPIGAAWLHSLKIYDVNGVLRRLGNPALKWERPIKIISDDMSSLKTDFDLCGYFKKRLLIFVAVGFTDIFGDYQPTL